MRRTALNLPTIDRIRRVVLDQSSECLGDDGFWFRAARVYVLSARSRALASARAYAPGQARERVSRPHLSSGATMLAALDRCRNRRFSSPTATGRNSTTESFETFPACRIDCGPGHPRDVCSPVSVRSDLGMIRCRREARSILFPVASCLFDKRPHRQRRRRRVRQVREMNVPSIFAALVQATVTQSGS